MTTEGARFSDFQIRAWTENDRASVIVHSSPVGDMRKPTVVPADRNCLSSLKETAREFPPDSPGNLEKSIELGRQLATVLLPPRVFGLLLRSLEHVEPSEGLRLRLCLDSSLIDLPWELLYRPDAPDDSPLAGFLVLDPRISLVREAPIPSRILEMAKGEERLVFVGLLGRNKEKEDYWEVLPEHRKILEALKPVENFLSMDPNFHSAAGDHIAELLVNPSAIFHYAGHVSRDSGALVTEAGDDAPVEYLSSGTLSGLLWRSGTRMAVFNACNSGDWNFVEPLLERAGLAALIGIQGIVYTGPAIVFSQRLYSDLAVGLSLDEAVTAARLHLLESEKRGTCSWSRFMVYMQSPSTAVLPRPKDRLVQQRQREHRAERDQTINSVAELVQKFTTALEHHLAAVWFADLVGYSRLASENENQALALVQLLQPVAQEAAELYKGRIVKFIGDATLAEFTSTEAAVRAAWLLRRNYQTRVSEAGLEPSSLRIGVHVGDVVQASDGDLYGDGVNVCARLQQAAEPDQIIVSGDVRRQLRQRPEFHFDRLGQRDLKGVGRIGMHAVSISIDEPMTGTAHPSAH